MKKAMIDGKFVRQLANEFMKGNESLYAGITKPRNGIYVMDRYIMNFDIPLIIGKITIEVIASPPDRIKNVSFYIDDELKYIDDDSPYQWLWDGFSIGKHEIKVIVYDNSGNKAEDRMNVLIFNWM